MILPLVCVGVAILTIVLEHILGVELGVGVFVGVLYRAGVLLLGALLGMVALAEVLAP